jgi:hypothetical protein
MCMRVTIEHKGGTVDFTDPYHVGRVNGSDTVMVWENQSGERQFFDSAEIIEVETTV